jgi:splicing factor U2AF subunit
MAPGRPRTDARRARAQFGAVQQVLIPRPAPEGQPPPPGLGKVIVAFEEVSAAASARSALNGRKFGGRVVVATFLSEEAFNAGSLD